MSQEGHPREQLFLDGGIQVEIKKTTKKEFTHASHFTMRRRLGDEEMHAHLSRIRKRQKPMRGDLLNRFSSRVYLA
jgi:hypothetical protein